MAQSAATPRRKGRLKPGPRSANAAAQRGGPALKQKILDVAIDLFAERGFAETRISDIATRAGAEAPTIYHYFGNKQGLYHSASRACFIGASDRSRVYLQADSTPADRVYGHALQTARALIDDRAFHMLLQRQLLELRDGDEMRAFVEGTFEEGLREFRGALDGLKPDGADNARLGVFIYCVLFGAARLAPLWETTTWIDFPEARNARLLTERVLKLLLPDVDWIACGEAVR